MENKQIDEREIRRDFSSEIAPEREIRRDSSAEITPDRENDTRNLIDDFKGLSVEEVREKLNQNRSKFHVAIENFQHDFNIGTIARNANASFT